MTNKLPKICMLADSHDLFDDRIYWKEAISLLKAGYEVHIVLADEKNDRSITGEGIHYVKVKREVYFENRYVNYIFKRLLPGGLYSKIFKIAKELKADVYHLHDLKMNRIGPKLKKFPWRPKLIYDVHEPYPENIRDYTETNVMLEGLKIWYSKRIQNWEKKCASKYDIIIVTEENLQKRFKSYFPDKSVEVIYNYTNLERPGDSSQSVKKLFDAIYTGGITKHRGAWKILEAVKIAVKTKPDFKMLFLGTWFPTMLKQQMQNYINRNKLDENIILKDSVPYCDVSEYYRQSKIGLGIFQPIETHQIILQIKIFEYLNFGLPVIGSNFGHIHRIIQKHECGISINPENPQEIAVALLNMISDNNSYNRMSKNGIQAVQENYKWEFMEKKLAGIYSSLLNKKNA